ncbi:MAG: hypothetical protein GVY13_17905 [Alphaproteobacteria bacterium]|jgi:flagellar assembly protein FliH|nr:hypothetical protein [Alphaproteobacteria bacterium]
MTYMQKFLFDTSFDPEDMRREEEARRQAREAAAKAEVEARTKAKAQAQAKPAEPTFSRADLNAARAEGYAAGEEAGKATALNSVQERLGEALSAVSRQLGPLVEQRRLDQETMVEQSVQIALAISRRVLPELARRKGLAEIEALVRDCLRDMSEEPRIVVRVSDEMLDLMRARIDPMAQSLGFPGSIVLLAEPSFGPADCRVEWADGGAERLAGQVWQEVETAVARFLEYPQSVLPGGSVAGARSQTHPAPEARPAAAGPDAVPWPPPADGDGENDAETETETETWAGPDQGSGPNPEEPPGGPALHHPDTAAGTGTASTEPPGTPPANPGVAEHE